jgi:hypothetical protein
VTKWGVIQAILTLVLFAPVAATAEAFPNPPLFPSQASDARGFMPSTSAWMGFRHFVPAPGGEMHSHDLDLGVDFLLHRYGSFSIEGHARQSLLTRLHPDGQWLFWPAAIYTDLGLRLLAEVQPVELALWYRHDCKHDIESYGGRDAVHDGIGASGSLRRISWLWGGSRTQADLGAQAGCEIFFPPIFQSVDAEPDRLKLFAMLDWEPLVVPGMPSVFLQASSSLILRTAETRVTVTEPWSLDWSASAGFRTPRRAGTSAGRLSIYAKIERVSDDWMGLVPQPLLLISGGILLQH